MSRPISYQEKITNTDLRTFIRKKSVCQCGDITLNESGKCDNCNIVDKLEEEYNGNR